MIHDDGFLQNVGWVKKFLEHYWSSIGAKFPLIIQLRANYPVEHPELIKALKEIGLEIAIVGFESGSDSVLKTMRKGTTRDINIKGAEILHSNGVKIFANIMFGTPGESLQDIKDTMSMVRIIKPEFFSAPTYSPYPGNDLHDFCQQNNLILDEYATRYPGEQKLKGVPYGFIQQEIDSYNREQNKLKFYLKHTQNPLLVNARNFFRKVRAELT
jgi:radical SAM superfamily enzyme YgiQ (UPF0313 family)